MDKMINSIRNTKVQEITTSSGLGVSFSLLSCSEYGVEWRAALYSTIGLGFMRFRLMSYWSLIEAEKGSYDFADLDEQLDIIEKAGGRVSLSIGMRQPRYPETHLPNWTSSMNSDEVESEYMKFHRTVIERYKSRQIIESWQLENEFWLKSFGKNFNYSRLRLKQEFQCIRHINPERPIIMTVASVLSLPIRKPTPDIYGTSMYRIIYNAGKNKYTSTWAKPWVYKIKKVMIKLLKNRDLIVHELQTEPWGPRANWEMDTKEQFKSIDAQEVAAAVTYAKSSGIAYIDLWGAEWWYWRSTKQNDTTLNQTVAKLVKLTDTA